MKIPEQNWTLTEEEMQRVKERCEEVGECLEWQMATSKGRPMMAIKRDGRWITVGVRSAIARAIGLEVSVSQRTVMTCGNIICLNPAHMKSQQVGTIVRNAAKKPGNGWQSLSRRIRLAEITRERFGKLTPEAIEDIRNGKEFHRVYMQRYGVSKTTVSRVKNFITHSPVLQKSNPWAGLFTGL